MRITNAIVWLAENDTKPPGVRSEARWKAMKNYLERYHRTKEGHYTFGRVRHR
jgi:hypothetical protein